MTVLQKPVRVFHAPHDVGGNAYYLAQGERRYGCASQNVVYTKQWFGYPADICLNLPQDANPLRYASWWRRMGQIALTADVLHFNFGSSFATYYPCRYVFADLPVWRALGIATFVTFQGCDSRLSAYACENFSNNACLRCRSREFCGGGYDTFKREVIAQAGRYFDGIFSLNPDLLWNIPRGVFLPYANCDLDAWTPPPDHDRNHSGPVRIVHAPTWREIKGTDAIVAAIDALKAEGHQIEFILVEKVPHDQVRKIYAAADLLIDQVHVGWYGGLAVELMALGKPVVAYIRKDDLRYVPEAMRNELPVVSADPSSLAGVLRGLLTDAGRRRAIGLRSRAFVEKWHHPDHVAAQTTGAYRRALAARPAVQGRINRLRTLMRLAKPTMGSYLAIYRNHVSVRQGMRRLAGRCLRKAS